ncbi:MAG: thermonuclease family protein [Candidatus Margulisiibacteriota bacterium]
MAVSGVSSTDSACVIKKTILPSNTIPAIVVKVVDGDTIDVRSEACKTEDVKTEGGVCRVRIITFNTTETLKEEFGSQDAKFRLKQELPPGKQVYIVPDGADSYHRLKARAVYVPSGKNEYISIAPMLLQAGLAHLFAFSPKDGVEEGLPCQREAKGEKKGLWNTKEFSGDLHITSFHANGYIEGSTECDGPNEPPNCEYFRLAVIADQAINLADYEVVNCATSKVDALPNLMVGPGRAIQVFSGQGVSSADDSGNVVIYLGCKKQAWDDKGALLIIRRKRDSAIQDTLSSRKDFICNVKKANSQ